MREFSFHHNVMYGWMDFLMKKKSVSNPFFMHLTMLMSIYSVVNIVINFSLKLLCKM